MTFLGFDMDINYICDQCHFKGPQVPLLSLETVTFFFISLSSVITKKAKYAIN